ncbi:hypothetical protein Glove_340g83 [Diversispora epigaea]|uniref:Uncharacterized protein n=1 Tax=Diversispora epigaea TaxID=1348612 RepID=A0A397HM69_9GLOM|nr:hypothetical protein Glove_340g83 [Diversispora epigaea]
MSTTYSIFSYFRESYLKKIKEILEKQLRDDLFQHRIFPKHPLVVSKVAGTDEILGDSFIFSLKNGNIQNSILSRVKDESETLYYCKSSDRNTCGPCFGYNEFFLESKFSDFTQDKELKQLNIFPL